MSEYPDGFEPFTDAEMREIFLARDLEEWAKLNPEHRNASGRDWDEWLAAHDAEVRARAVAEGPEWEYGIRPVDDDVPLGVSPMPTLEAAQTRANNIRGGWSIVRRRKAGPWVPVEQGDET